MKVVKPTAITSAMLVSTTATETYAPWNAATSYTIGTVVLLSSTQRLYSCLVAGIDATAPDASALLSVPHWLDVGPTNKWAMFDNEISTQTSTSTNLTVVVKPGLVNSLALFGLEGGGLSVVVRDAYGGTVVYSKNVVLEGAIVGDWYQYFFEAFVQLGEVVLTDLPPYGDAHITVAITAGGTVKCGILAAGTAYDLGDTLAGASASITDYSRKETDTFGVTTFVRRAYSKRMSSRMLLPNTRLNKTQQVLADLRATPCAWIGSGTPGFEPLTVFGFYRDFSIDVAYADTSFCSLEVEGLT